jgi:hypothetical protein
MSDRLRPKEPRVFTAISPWDGQSAEVVLKYEYDTAVRALTAEANKLAEALRFYADPMSYFGIGIFPDQPAGEFWDDIDEVPWPNGGTNHKPGKRARAALAEREDK